MAKHDTRPEQMVLAVMLHDASQCRRLCRVLTPTDFADTRHRGYFEALQRASRDSRWSEATIEMVELHTPRGEFTQKDLRYLQKIHDAFPAKKVRRNLDAHIERMRWIATKTQIQEEVLPDLLDALEDPESSREDVSAAARSVERIARVSDEATRPEDYRETLKNRRAVSLITTGWDELDRVLVGGYRKGLHVLAAKPSAGKTAAVVSSILLSADPELARPTTWLAWPFEDGAEAYFDRMLSQLTGVPYGDVVRGLVDVDAVEELVPYRETVEVRGMPNWPIATSYYKQNEVRLDYLEGEIAEAPQDVIVLDMFKMALVDKRPQAYEAGVMRLAEIAERYNKHVIAVHHIGRKPDSTYRDDKRPTLSDIEWSSSFEQYAQVCSVLHRPDFYRKTRARLEWIVRKQKAGQKDVIVEFEWDGVFARCHSPTVIDGENGDEWNDAEEYDEPAAPMEF